MRKIKLILIIVLSLIAVGGFYYNQIQNSVPTPASMFLVYDDSGVRKTAQLNDSDIRRVCPECDDGVAVVTLNRSWSIDENGTIIGLNIIPKPSIINETLQPGVLVISYVVIDCNAVFVGGYNSTFSFLVQDKKGLCYFGYEFPKIPTLPTAPQTHEV